MKFKRSIILFLFILFSQLNCETNGIKLGAIRWDGWAGSNSWVGKEAERTLSPNRYHYRVPFFGIEVDTGKVLINGNDQSIVDKEILYANYAGLDYWAFVWHYPCEWGWDYGQNLYKTSKYKHLIDFCWIMQPSYFINLISIDQIVNDFKDPSYVKVMGNRPLMYFFFGYYNDIDTNDIKELRRKTVEAGLGQPYLVLMNEYTNYKILDSLKLDAMSDYAHWSFNGNPYSSLAYMDWYYWRLKGVDKSLNIIPTVTSGWDKRCNYDAKTEWDYKEEYKDYWVVMPTPEELADHIKLAIDWSAGWYDVVEAKSIIIYAWNEHSEGGFLCPTLKNYAGTARIEAIRKKLGLGDYIQIEDQTYELYPCYGDKNSFIYCKPKNPDSLNFDYTWYKDDIEIRKTNSPYLYFDKVDSNTTGYYKCKVTLDGFNDSAKSQYAVVKVIQPVKIISKTENYSKILSDSIKFELNGNYNNIDFVDCLKNKTINVNWYKINENDTSIIIDNSNIIGAKTNILKIKEIQKSDFGEYFLKINTNCGNFYSEKFQLNEFILTANIKSDSTKIKCISDSLKLIANTNSDNTKLLKYQWYNNDKALLNNNRIIGSTSEELNLFELDFPDSGNYKCKIEFNKYSIFTNSIYLKLKDKAQFEIIAKDTLLDIGKELKIELINFDEQDTLVKYSWFKNDKKLNYFNKNLVINKVQLIDSGDYFCEISNECGIIKTSKIYISVKDFSDILIDENTNKAYELRIIDGFLEIEYRDKLQDITYEIYNILGEKIPPRHFASQIATPQEGNLRIEISNLPAGVYFIRIGNRIEKFIIF